MVEEIGWTLSVVLPMFTAWIVWWFWNIDQTFEQRKKMRDRIMNDPEWIPSMRMYSLVSFHQHTMARVFFKNPLRLYPHKLQEFLSEKK